jgi:hypothetical protein
MSFTTNHRFNIAAFAIAAIASLALNGTMLSGFNQLAVNGAHSEADIVRLTRIAPSIPAVMLERVVVTARHA